MDDQIAFRRLSSGSLAGVRGIPHPFAVEISDDFGKQFLSFDLSGCLNYA